MNRPQSNDLDRHLVNKYLSEKVVGDLARIIRGIEEAQSYGHVILELNFKDGKRNGTGIVHKKTFLEEK